jgi:hypothetical protein
MTSFSAGPHADQEALLEQLRVRASDPLRRVDRTPGRLASFLHGAGLGGRRSRPASPAAVRAAEAQLELTLPPLLVRIYTEVADGGFGPEDGLLSLQGIVRETHRLRVGDELPRHRTWPATLIPLVRLDMGWICLDAASGVVIDWDFEDMTERMSEARFSATFSERSPTILAWLGRWVTRKSAADRSKPSGAEREARLAAHWARPERRAIERRKAIRLVSAMSSAERAGMGLPEEGWEDIVRGWYPDIGDEMSS